MAVQRLEPQESRLKRLNGYGFPIWVFLKASQDPSTYEIAKDIDAKAESLEKRGQSFLNRYSLFSLLDKAPDKPLINDFLYLTSIAWLIPVLASDLAAEKISDYLYCTPARRMRALADQKYLESFKKTIDYPHDIQRICLLAERDLRKSGLTSGYSFEGSSIFGPFDNKLDHEFLYAQSRDYIIFKNKPDSYEAVMKPCQDPTMLRELLSKMEEFERELAGRIGQREAGRLSSNIWGYSNMDLKDMYSMSRQAALDMETKII